jgi:hypothetical protein
VFVWWLIWIKIRDLETRNVDFLPLHNRSKRERERERWNNLIVQRRRRPEQKGRLLIALKEAIVISYEWITKQTQTKLTAPTSQLLIGWMGVEWMDPFSTIVSYLIILQCQIMSATNTFIHWPVQNGCYHIFKLSR